MSRANAVTTAVPQRPAALFDFDGTLLRGDSTFLCLLFSLRRHPASAGTVLALAGAVPLFAAGLLSRQRLKEIALGALRHIPEGGRDRFFDAFNRDCLIPRLRPEGLRRLRWHREKGHRLIMVSASVDLYLGPLVRDLDIPELVCTRASLDPRPRLLGPNCRGEEKVRRLLSHPDADAILWEESWAYGDSGADAPLMARCGHPVAICPNAALRRLARRRGWDIQHW